MNRGDTLHDGKAKARTFGRTRRFNTAMKALQRFFVLIGSDAGA